MPHHMRIKLTSRRIALFLIAIVMLAAANSGTLISHAKAAKPRAQSSSRTPGFLTGAPENSTSVMYQGKHSVGCRASTPEETRTITGRDQTRELHSITPPSLLSDNGLQIILRATDELAANPKAKAAFLRAADVWASHVQTPTTVIIDVDFGPTWFGDQFPQGVIGMTNPQMLIGPDHYYTVLGRLMESATNTHESGLYNALPNASPIPTDLGDTTWILAPSSVYRTLGLIPADPNTDPIHFGPPPAIGFNAALDFDFDSSDGIDAGKIDFEAAAAHEIGHVLGFVSAVGQREINPDCDLAVTVWDLFRLRPGASMGGLATSPRILSSGGAQVFFEGDGELQLSTGRPDGTGGDGLQPSHWRDDSIVGERIGIMDPTMPAGAHQTVTFNDLEALDLFGYTIKPFGNNPPKINSLAGDLNGDVLTLTGSASDADGDVVKVEAQFLDFKGHVLAQTAPFNADFGITTSLALNLRFTGLGGLPEATQVAAVLIDSRGNRSTAVSADFSGGDPGAVKLLDGAYEKNALRIKGKRITPDVQVEINGVVISPSPESVSVTPNGKKLVITAPSESLNLRSGANRIRLISGGLRSSLLVVSL